MISCFVLFLFLFFSNVVDSKSGIARWIYFPHETIQFPLFICCICLLLLILMLWQRQAIFESKKDKLSSSAECRIRTQGLKHQIASRPNGRWQIDWAIKDQNVKYQATKLSSTARPYDQRSFRPLDPYLCYKLDYLTRGTCSAGRLLLTNLCHYC